MVPAPYLTKKLSIISMDEIDWNFRKYVIQLLPDSMYIQLSKSFTNFSGIAHQLYRQNIVSSLVCRMCNVENETDTWHVLSCTHQLFNQYKSEVISKLQLKIFRLLEDDIFPLCFLEWMLDNEYIQIDGVLEHVMSSLQRVSKRNIWYSFLLLIFLKQIYQKYESIKWLAKYMVL